MELLHPIILQIKVGYKVALAKLGIGNLVGGLNLTSIPGVIGFFCIFEFEDVSILLHFFVVLFNELVYFFFELLLVSSELSPVLLVGALNTVEFLSEGLLLFILELLLHFTNSVHSFEGLELIIEVLDVLPYFIKILLYLLLLPVIAGIGALFDVGDLLLFHFDAVLFNFIVKSNTCLLELNDVAIYCLTDIL